MNRLSAAGLLALGIAHATYAQDWVSSSSQANRATTPYVVRVSKSSVPTTLDRKAAGTWVFRYRWRRIYRQ